MKPYSKRTILACILGLFALAGCTKTREVRSPAGLQTGKLRLCGAVRGNGPRVFSTIAAMASFTENYGTFDALAGASSGGIANFIYESVLMSPVLHDCGAGAPCSEELVRRRAGLMLKGFQGYIDYVSSKDSPEASPFWVLKAFEKKLKDKGVESLLAKDAVKAFRAVHEILSQPDIRGLVNKDILDFVDLKRLAEHKQDPKALKQKLERLVATTKEGFNLERSDPELLVRTGLPDLFAISRLIGRIGDFYAGRGPELNKQGWISWMNACTAPTFRKPWTQIRGTPCGKQFDTLVREYHAFFEQKAVPAYRSRASDPIGGFIPTLNSTSMVAGKENVESWRLKKRAYDQGSPDWRFQPANFDRDFKLGYWGRPEDLQFIAERVGSWGDYKSERFFPLGQGEWSDVIARSASEPGLNHALPYQLPSGDEVLTTGGWTDGHSVLVLRSLGCERVVYVTRRDEDSTFAKGVAKSLGMPEADSVRLFGTRLDATEPYSSHELSLMQASGTWCTNWNHTAMKPDLLGNDGHNGLFQVNPEPTQGPRDSSGRVLAGQTSAYRFFEDRKIYPDPYPRASAHTGQIGCEVRTKGN